MIRNYIGYVGWRFLHHLNILLIWNRLFSEIFLKLNRYYRHVFFYLICLKFCLD